MNRKSPTLLLAFLTITWLVAQAGPLGSGFTYQGRLTTGTNAASGNYDMKFSLYDALAIGSQIGNSLTNTAASVSNGYFAVTLDFGPVFDGNARWLEIGVSTNGAGAFTILSPRQPLTPAPFALYAANAGEATTAATAIFVAANGVPNASLQPGAVTTDKIADGTIGTDDIASLNAGKVIGGDLAASRLKVGVNHTLTGGTATIAGGTDNTASAGSTVVGGGYYNTASGYAGIVGGGGSNSATNDYTTVAGGWGNKAYGPGAFIGGGGWDGVTPVGNTATGAASTIAGGRDNSASGTHSTVGGGWKNMAIGFYATASGGSANKAGEYYGGYATVGGGVNNVASGYGAAIGGGTSNSATNGQATIPGGLGNLAGGQFSFAAGRRAKALGDGSFVWGDSRDFDVFAYGANEFVARATGGFYLFTAINASGSPTAGVVLRSGDPGWQNWCDRDAKENLRPVDGRAILEKLSRLQVSEWNMKAQAPSVRHLGPMAQDFHAAFGLGGDDDRRLSSVDVDGVALAAIQGLNQIVKEKNSRIEKLEKDVTELKAMVTSLLNQSGSAGQLEQ